jgi:hypothetical protein
MNKRQTEERYRNTQWYTNRKKGDTKRNANRHVKQERVCGRQTAKKGRKRKVNEQKDRRTDERKEKNML